MATDEPTDLLTGDGLPAVLTVDEVAGLLRVNRKTVYAAVAQGAIPGVVRVGGTIRVCRDAVLAWLAGEGRVSSSRRDP
ncbi:DNA-binding protein [Patescibacteria group bacterium]|nr:MAG: DNA-binding protein [Patescibacteria group bacterium]